MEIDKFIANFAAQFDETDPGEIKSYTIYKEIEEWSSLTALSIIAMVDEEYNVSIKGDDIRKTDSVEDLFNIVKERLN